MIQTDITSLGSSYAPVRHIDFGSCRRVIAVSDIHGDYNGFQGVLKKLNFTALDALVIVGDILEKGPASLKLLREIIRLSKQGNVFVTVGNNDILFQEWYSGEITEKEVLWYMHSRKNSILIEMAYELCMPFETLEDIAALKCAVKEHYTKELAFLDKLPYIIDSNIATFVHAGLSAANIHKQDKHYCLTAKAFGKKELTDADGQPFQFKKPLVVGHWPASNYHNDIINVNPYFNQKTNVYSIDGGNSMKLWQQINYLIFKNNVIHTGYYDSLPKIEILETQTATNEPITLTFPNTLLEIKEKKNKKSICYLPYLDRQMTIADSSIYTYKGQMYSSDFTTYYLPLHVHDIVSLCENMEDEILVKKDGIVGKYKGKYEWMGCSLPDESYTL